MDELRVPKQTAHVELALSHGQTRRVSLYLAEYASGHHGAERVSDLLNGAQEFLPALDADTSTVLLISRSSILRATVEASRELDDTEAGDDAQVIPVAVSLAEGSTVRGVVRFLRPAERARLVDYLNEPERFLRLLDEESASAIFISKRMIVDVRVVS